MKITQGTVFYLKFSLKKNHLFATQIYIISYEL